MGAARGIGAFAEGFMDGYKTGEAIKSQREMNEREKRKMALMEAQDVRAGEAHKQQLELGTEQISKAKMENEEAKRKQAMAEQVKNDSTALESWLSGQGDQPGFVPLVLGGKKGLGATQTVDPNKLTQTDIDKLRAGVFQKARVDHGQMDEDTYIKFRNLRKTFEKEGVLDAFDVFERTGNSDASLQKFAESGGIKPQPGMFLKKGINPITGQSDTIVYGPGPDGKPQPMTSKFEILLGMMPEKLIDYGMEGYKQSQANVRQGMNDRTNIIVAGMNNSSAERVANAKGSTTGQFTYKDEVEALNKLQNSTITYIGQDATLATKRPQYLTTANLAATYARAYISKGANANQAWLYGMQEAAKKTGIQLPQIQTGQ